MLNCRLHPVPLSPHPPAPTHTHPPHQRGSSKSDLQKYITVNQPAASADVDWKAFGLALRKAVASGALRVVKGRYMLPTPATADATTGDADNAADVAADDAADGDSKSDSEAADSSNSGGGSDSDTAGEADSDAGDVDTMLQAAITAVRKVCAGVQEGWWWAG